MSRKTHAAALLGATLLSTSVWAQETDEIIVLSSPFKKPATKVISTTEILTAEDLQASSDLPIGTVLKDLPGVDSARYGPAVGQPVIRGLGGYRVDTMINGMSIGDIAATSGDHANALSLFDTERVEVLKGPAALRYGAFAASGVVNSFNRHFNTDREEEGDVLVGFGNNADEAFTAFFTRQGRFSLSGFAQDADNMTIPTHRENEAYHEAHDDDGNDDDDDNDRELSDDEKEVENTQNESRGFALAGHFGDDETNLSLMLISHEADYGVPGHEEHDDKTGEADGDGDHDIHGEANIDLEQQTIQARLNHNAAVGPFRALRADATITSLELTEFEGDETTPFEQDSLHLRGEGVGQWGDWQTLIGLEFRDTELTTEGDDDDHHDDVEDNDLINDAGTNNDGVHDDAHAQEAYLPSTGRTQLGLFAFAERESNGWLTELAVRFDDIELEAEHDHDGDDAHDDGLNDGDDGEDAHEDEGAKSFTLANISVGLAKKLGGNLLIGGSVSSSERAPSQVELFAAGVHHAARRIEQGDDELDKETSLSAEFYVRKAWKKSQLRVAVFNNDYTDFIYLQRDALLNETDINGAVVTPGYRYAQDDAELSGYEIDYLAGINVGKSMIDVGLSYSAIIGELSDGQNLPAIPADKIHLSIGTSFTMVDMRLDMEHAWDQNDIGAEELPTEGHTTVDISASWQPSAFDGLILTAAVRNLTDEEIRHHNSPLKDRLPEAGQDIRLTARYKF